VKRWRALRIALAKTGPFDLWLIGDFDVFFKTFFEG
jgi:hypothetical protein